MAESADARRPVSERARLAFAIATTSCTDRIGRARVHHKTYGCTVGLRDRTGRASGRTAGGSAR